MLKFPAFFKIERKSLPLEPQKQTRAMNTGEPMIPLAASSASGLLDFIDLLSWKSVVDDCFGLDTTEEAYGMDGNPLRIFLGSTCPRNHMKLS